MDKHRFWAIIDEARNESMKSSDNIEDMDELLIEKLSKFGEEEIIHWGLILDLYQQLSYKDTLWAADFVINDHLSDDGFDYFRAWVTAHGKQVFLNALRNPDSLADLRPQRLDTWFEGLLYVCQEAYYTKTKIAGQRFYNECAKYSLSQKEISEIEEEIVYADNSVDANECEFAWEDDKGLLKETLPNLWIMFMSE